MNFMRTIKAFIKWHIQRRINKRNVVHEVPPRPCPPRDPYVDGFNEYTENLAKWKLNKK